MVKINSLFKPIRNTWREVIQVLWLGAAKIITSPAWGVIPAPGVSYCIVVTVGVAVDCKI